MAKDTPVTLSAPGPSLVAGPKTLPSAFLSGLDGRAAAGTERRLMEYAMLAILVRVEHLRHAEALALIKGLEALGLRLPELLLARAIVESGMELNESVLTTIRELDRMDPPEVSRGRRIDEKVRVRSFLKARAIFALTGTLNDEGRASIDFYLRQSKPGPTRRPERPG